jgi:pyruvate dehydrogenase (quinone)
MDAKALPRRQFLLLSGATGAAMAAAAGAVSALQPSTALPNSRPESTLEQPSLEQTTADILVETLIAWEVPFVFGIVGDGINPIIEALRKRQDKIRYIGVRHEEAAAFMASVIAKHTGKLGVCLGTTGPGAVHGFRCSKPAEVGRAIADTLRSPRAALLEAVVDANERPAKPDELKV